MKKRNKLISLNLVIVMLLSLLTPAIAAEPEETTATEQNEIAYESIEAVVPPILNKAVLLAEEPSEEAETLEEDTTGSEKVFRAIVNVDPVLALRIGDTETVLCSVICELEYDGTVETVVPDSVAYAYTISDENVATVSSDGTISAVGEGTAVLTVMACCVNGEYACEAVSAVSVNVSSGYIAEGVCGDNLTWTLDDDGVLTFAGNGEMADSTWPGYPWKEYQDQITSVCFNEGITTIHPFAFEDYTAIRTISLPNSLTEIGYYAFHGCSSIEKVVIPPNVKIVGEHAFSFCTNLNEIIAPSIALNSSTFAFCGEIQKLTITDNLNIPNDAFDGSIISELLVPGGYKKAPTKVLNSKFVSAERIVYQTDNPDEIACTWYIGGPDVGETDVKATVYADGRMVISGNGSFVSSPWKAAAPIVSVSMEDGITGMIEYSFSDCFYIEEVVLSNDLTIIPMRAFENCYSLKTIDLPSRLTSVRSYSFRNCRSLSTIVIPDSVTLVDRFAFYGCTNLKSIYLGKGISKIFESAFGDCTCLSNVYWNVQNCQDLEYGDEVFLAAGQDNANGFSLIVGTSVERIPAYLFYSSSSVTEVYPHIASISVDNNNDVLNEIGPNAFYHCADLSAVDLGDSVTTIGDNAFSLCTSLNEIELPGSLQTIGYKSFFGTPLTNVTIGRNVTFVDQAAFEDSSLKTITGYSGTYAETYANENGYEFIALAGSGEVSDTMTWSFDAMTGTLTFQGDGEILFGDWITQCQGLTSIMVPEGCTALNGKASDYRKLFPQLQSIFFLGNVPDLLNEKPFAEHNGTIKIYHLKTASGWDAIAWPNCELYTFANELVEVTINSRIPEAENDGNTLTITAYKGTDIDLSVYADELELIRQQNHNVQGQLALWVDQNGTGNLDDAVLTVTDDMTLDAHWDTAAIMIDGKYYDIQECTSGETWSISAETYLNTATNNTTGVVREVFQVRSCTLYLTDYIGGSIELPGDAAEYAKCYHTIYLIGDNAISGHIKGNTNLILNVQGKSSLEMTSSDVCLESSNYVSVTVSPTSSATFTSTGTAPVVKTKTFNMTANGPVNITAMGNVGVQATTANLYGSSVLTISAVSSAVNCAVTPPAEAYNLYLSPDATETVTRYSGGPYLRLEGKTWTLPLYPSGGIWEDGSKTEKAATAGIDCALSLTEYSEQLSRDGYRLTGWTSADGNATYEPDGYVISGEADKLYAVWKKEGVTIGGNHYSSKDTTSGTGWSISNGILTLSSSYTEGQIIAVGEITINANDNLVWNGPLGYPALSAYGDVILNVQCDMLTINGGSGATALDIRGNLTINNQNELLIKGGDGGCGIDCIELTLNNSGVVSVVGGINGYAVYAENAAINEIGVTTFVGGATKAAAVSGGNLVLDEELKSYYGDNAATTTRGMNTNSKYLRFEQKTILVNLNLDGGEVSEAQLLSVSMDQNAANEMVLDVEVPEKFGYSFQGWQDSTGHLYETGATYAFSDTQDSLNLQAVWEVLEYDVRTTDEGIEIIINDPVPEGSSVLLTSYSDSGQMQKVAFGTCIDGIWKFDFVPDGDWKLFFINQTYSPTQEYLPIED